MADEPTPGATPGAGGATPTAGQGDPGTGAAAASASDDRSAANAKEALARIATERDEARAELKRLKEKDLPEAERTARRLSELEAAEKAWQSREQDLVMEAQAVRLAAKLGFADAEDALGWLARNRDQVEFDGGRPTNLERLLRELLKSKPHYLAEAVRPRGSAEGGARGTGAPVDFNAAIRRAAGR